jgi:D-glycero-alpha-D-manno-heptose-7-phosphate kinase
VRVDLAGGTLDIWPLYLFHPGAMTVNFAIRCHATAAVETRSDGRLTFSSRDQRIRESFDSLRDLEQRRSALPLLRQLVLFFAPRGGLNIWTSSESPAGAGLGGSSALNIALCGAIAGVTGRRLARAQLLEIARNIEAIVIGVPTGCQDYFPPLYGGVSAIHLERDGVKRERLPLQAADLEQRFVLCYTGHPRNSAINNWEVMKAHIDGNRKVQHNFQQIAAIAGRMREALLAKNWNDVEDLLAMEWENRKRNFRGISTPRIERIIKQAGLRGALAAKVCGAGGGGCVVLLVHPGMKRSVERALRTLGGQIINCAVSPTGLEVRSGHPKGGWEAH